MTNPIRPTDDEARQMARGLIATARHAALAVHDPDTGHPSVTRIACLPGPDGLPVSLISDLSQHTRALDADPRCSLLLGEPGDKGDPLTHPRLTIQATARFVRQADKGHKALADHIVRLQPKAKLYIGFADFRLVIFAVDAAFLNGGFGKAYTLNARDLSAT